MEPKRYSLTAEAKAEIDALYMAQQHAEATLRLGVRLAQKTLGIPPEYRYMIDDGVFVPAEEVPAIETNGAAEPAKTT